MSISSYAADLYFMLIEECYANSWRNPFTVETKNIEQQLGISRPTICKARKELVALGLIQFEDGKNGSCTPCYVLSNIETDR